MGSRLFDDTLNHIGWIDKAGNAQEVCDRLLGITARFGLDRMIVGTQAALNETARSENADILQSGWPESWVERYLNRDYARISLVVRYAKRTMRPFDWNEATEAAGRRHPGNAVMEEISQFGIRRGISVPSITSQGLPALLSLGGEAMELAEREFSMVSLISTYAMEKAIRLAQGSRVGRFARLTQREAECIRWAAEGKSEWEISRILGISEHTSEKHLLSAKTKLGAVNRTQAVAMAIREGYIT
ncbi:MAG: LuxR family transcriptional regulator [Zhengella sp.]|uniref:LuxR family transcriptional regulator n=1 Tax=Zhengella sp. TaxID=2282762 RepID=UPI001E1032BF|nr:LuxR family transcriptional regulator [Notoacmeibacter sp.]MCC0025421.1 LuxR family transcriptional regulator [Brucellaceae bacterium]